MNSSVPLRTLWDETNRALEFGLRSVKGVWGGNAPATPSQAQIQGGLGVDFYPRGSGYQSIPISQDAYKSKYNSWLDKAQDKNTHPEAATVDYSTKAIRIPTGANNTGVNPEFIGVAQVGAVNLTDINRAQPAFVYSDYDISGWKTAVASIQVLDSASYSSMGNINRARNSQMPTGLFTQ